LAEKTLRNDIEFLRKIVKHQNGINETLSALNLKTANDIIANNVALKALAMDVCQIGELADKISKDTMESFTVIDAKIAYSIRNRIAHAYLNVKPLEIALTAMQLGSSASIEEVKERIKFCVASCRKVKEATEEEKCSTQEQK